jgi:hypothetical protein
MAIVNPHCIIHVQNIGIDDHVIGQIELDFTHIDDGKPGKRNRSARLVHVGQMAMFDSWKTAFQILIAQLAFPLQCSFLKANDIGLLCCNKMKHRCVFFLTLKIGIEVMDIIA